MHFRQNLVRDSEERALKRFPELAQADATDVTKKDQGTTN
jgi:hypothetical protein